MSSDDPLTPAEQALVVALVTAIVRELRSQKATVEPSKSVEQATAPIASKWLSVKAAAAYLGRSKRVLYKEVKAGRMKAAHVGDSGTRLMFNVKWLDEWAESMAEPRRPRR